MKARQSISNNKFTRKEMRAMPGQQWYFPKKFIGATLCSLVVAITAGLVAFSASARTLTITGAVWCPNNCYPSRDKPGIMLELSKRALEVQGYNISYYERPWSRAVLETRAGLFDALIGPSKSDAPDFIFPTEPVAIAQNCFFTHKATRWKYSGIDSLQNVRLGIGRDETVSESIDSYVSSPANASNVVVLSGTDYMERLIGMLGERRLSAVIADVNVFTYMLKNRPQIDSVKNAGCMGEPLKIYLAFSPKSYNVASSVIMQFDEGMTKLKKSGEFARILERYNATPW